MDLPFAQARWCGAAGVEAVETLSDHRDASFGQGWGALIKELRLLTRAVFVVGKDGKVAYVEYLKEITEEPDYASALAAARSLVG
jgi:thiol peroxidase